MGFVVGINRGRERTKGERKGTLVKELFGTRVLRRLRDEDPGTGLYP